MELILYTDESNNYRKDKYMGQEISSILELIRKPRKRSSNNTISKIPVGGGVILFCLVLVLVSVKAWTERRYDIILVYAVAIVTLLYFNFDFINIKEVINYRNTDYYKLTKIPFTEVLNDKGVRGEFYSYLLFRHIKGYHKMLFNTYIPMPNGSFQEIDAIAICERGIFIIESKNRNGMFEGDAEDKVWKQYIGSQEHELHNPIDQNQKHRIALDYYFKSNQNLRNSCELSPYDFLLESLILFAEGADLNISGEIPAYVLVVNRKAAYDYIKYIANSESNTMKPADIDRIYNELLPLSTLSKQEKTAKMQYRERMSELGKYKRRDYIYYEYTHYNELDNFINWNNEERNIIRYDGVYAELYLEKHSMWVAIPDIDFDYATELSLSYE